ncbi:60S ribosomal protein L6 [Cinnamomum micranthum f. kanehirae]|uniref:60S ribosomal protein L6 n=1 Tax=Cinnamomum micranthum f. kanehirae TaxID=337451 RepID=A0A443N435_9MAGN|nr:60S ribosomal protein L6 [Cinnamomum micranthum f. kanehirae]
MLIPFTFFLLPSAVPQKTRGEGSGREGRIGSIKHLPPRPFKVNGVPLRRVNQAYVIATSTKVDISCVDVEKFDDKYFTKERKKKQKKGEGEFYEAEKELLKSLEAVPELEAYLSARFSLRSGMKPHELVF